MFSVETVCKLALQLVGRGDKPSNDDLNQAIALLQLILSDWASTRDVHLWNIYNATQDLSMGDRVLGSDGSVYQCAVNHTAATDNEPITGDNYNDYWRGANVTTNPLTWGADNAYDNAGSFDITSSLIEDILAVKVLHAGQFSAVERVSMMDFQELDKFEMGLPTKCFVQRISSTLRVHLWPLCNVENATLHFYEVSKPSFVSGDQIVDIPDQWIKALYYALAVELGFVYNIKSDRIQLIGAKSASEFKKAFLTNESEEDSCFVKPLY